MITLIEKDKELQELLDIIPETQKGTRVRDLINKAVEKAYKSGFMQFNALTHELVEDYSDERVTARWHEVSDDPFLLGETAELVRTYLIENGYAH